MAILKLYPRADANFAHLSTASDGHTALRDIDDNSYIYQHVDNTNFVTLTSTFYFDTYSLKNVTINSVSAVVRARVTSNDGVNFAHMKITGAVSSDSYASTPGYNTWTDCSFKLKIGDIGLSSATITTRETHENLQFSLESRVKKTTSSKADFDLQIAEIYIVVDYTVDGSTYDGDQVLITEGILSDIADAIRLKNNTTIKYTPNSFANAIIALDSTGASIQQYVSIAPTEEYQYAYPDAGYDGIYRVIIQPISSTYIGSGVNIQYYYTGSDAPSNSLGNNGDLYFQETT